jgi:ribosomal protein L32
MAVPKKKKSKETKGLEYSFKVFKLVGTVNRGFFF